MNREFEVHMLNELGKEKAQAIAEAFDELLNKLTSLKVDEHGCEYHDSGTSPICPAGRELSIVKTKLEEACFFAKKAMASQRENCLPGPGEHEAVASLERLDVRVKSIAADVVTGEEIK